MKRILCYGDSNTWGYTPGSGVRFGPDVRWTGILQKELGSEAYTVIEEGLNARTTVYEHPRAMARKGSDYLLPCLLSQRPLDLVILMLGTNDLQWTDAYGAAEGAKQLVKDIRWYSKLEESSPMFAQDAKILLVAPPLVHPDIASRDAIKRRHRYVEESQLFSKLYEAAAQATGCEFLDAAKYTEPSIVDGLHLEADSHARLGHAVAQKVKEIFK